MVKIYGNGWVGKAMQTLFPDALMHDPPQGLINDAKADIAFICVPTPNPDQTRLDTSIVEDIIKNAQENILIIRSTVNPGDCDQWAKRYQKNIVFMPEYLGETPDHPLLDKKHQRFLIIGGEPHDRRKVIELFQQAYNANISIRQTTNLEAEIIKLSENRAIMFKVLECQELYDTCQSAGVDYYTIRDAVYGDDPRFNLWWTFVYPDARGANSKCLPKDPYAWAAWAKDTSWDKDNGKLTNALLAYNEGLLND